MDKIEKAALYAIKCHEGQKRKIRNSHYFFHPMEVAFIAESLTDDIDTIVAALLHDTVEDCELNPINIEKEFGKRVKELVLAETENPYKEISKSESWKRRKEEALKILKETNDIDIKIIFLADKLANLRSLYRAYLREGLDAFNHFHTNDPKLHEWYYRSILAYTSDLKDTLPYKEFNNLINEIFGGTNE